MLQYNNDVKLDVIRILIRDINPENWCSASKYLNNLCKRKEKKVRNNLIEGDIGFQQHKQKHSLLSV